MITDQRMLFPEPATISKVINLWENMKEQRGARFPWIHNNDVANLDFHPSDILPWKNHVAVPSC
jgi:hypothetical protein